MPIYPSNKNSIGVKKKRHQSRIGIVFVCTFSLLLLELIFNIVPFVNNLLYGVLGLSIYPLSIFFILVGVMKIKRVKVKLSSKEISYLVLCFICLVGMAHIFTSSIIINNSYRVYLADTFSCNKVYTAGGVIFSFLLYPFYSITHTAGVSVMLAILMLLFICLFVDSMYKKKQTQMHMEDSVNHIIKNTSQSEFVDNIMREEQQDSITKKEVPYDEDLFIDDEDPEKQQEEFADKNIARRILGLDKTIKIDIDEEDEDLFIDEESDIVDKQFRPQMVVHDEFVEEEPVFEMVQTPQNNIVQNSKVDNSKILDKYERDKKNKDYLDDIMGRNVSNPTKEIQSGTNYTYTKSSAKEKLFGVNSSNNLFGDRVESHNMSSMQNANSRITNNYQNNISRQNGNNKPSNNVQESFDIYDDNLTLKSYEKNKAEYINKLNNFDTASAQIAKAQEVYNMKENTARVESTAFTNNVVNVNEINKIKPMAEKTKVKRRPYVKPPIDLLETYRNDNILEEDNTEKTIRLEATLDSFRIPAKVCSVAKGPSFTRFELTMPAGIPVKKIDNLVPDMQMALACRGAIRTEIPIPGKNAFGVEIPNEQKETVGLKDIIDSYEFQNSKYTTAYGLGKDISNSPIVGNIEKMPHLLVAGTTGSGKSVCLNSMLVSLLFKSGPEDLRLILVDPKRLEFSLYNGLPHLLIPNVITDKEKAMNAFDWLIDEMNRRINYFDSLKAGIRNLEEYNASQKVKNGEWEKMPRIVVVVDELNELMMQTRKEMESKIVRIAQLSRAVGIHLVLATQRPSVDVITGLVKSNLPSRIAFAVSSFNDSMTILNQGGAESLLGFGDMLYSPVGTNKPIRLQGAFLKNSEVEKVVEFIKANNDCIFDEEIEDQMFNRGGDNLADSGSVGGGSASNNTDPLMKDVLRFAIKSGGISTTRVQRYLRIGYPRAAKIIDDMEALNYISKKDDKNNRVIFMTQQEFEEVFGEDF